MSLLQRLCQKAVTSRYFWIFEFKFSNGKPRTLTTHCLAHLQQLCSHTQPQQRPTNLPKSHIKAKSVDCTVQTAKIAPETASTETKNGLRGLRNMPNSHQTPSTHPIWCMQRFISHNACQTRSGTLPRSHFSTLWACCSGYVRKPLLAVIFEFLNSNFQMASQEHLQHIV